MPIYEYAPKSGKCQRCDGRFEVYQKIADAPLRRCPDCRRMVVRVVSAPSVPSGRFSTSDSRVKELGMTKYKKAGDGVYERVAGTGGPRIIHRKKTVV